MSGVPDRMLARPAILEAIKQKRILVEPFDERYVKGCSVDVRLGETYFAEQPAIFSDVPESEVGARLHELLPDPHRWTNIGGTKIFRDARPFLNPYDKESVHAMYGEAKMAMPLPFIVKGIPTNAPVILIPPGGVFLGHTHEFIGSIDPEITFMVKARSTTGRLRIRVCSCAGLGDPGYANRITLELANDSHRWIPLVPGRRIGQIVFIPTTPLPLEDMYSGKYQRESPAGKSFDELVRSWDPEEMLPRAYMDWELSE